MKPVSDSRNSRLYRMLVYTRFHIEGNREKLDLVGDLERDLHQAWKDCDRLVEANPAMSKRYYEQRDEVASMLYEKLKKEVPCV